MALIFERELRGDRPPLNGSASDDDILYRQIISVCLSSLNVIPSLSPLPLPTDVKFNLKRFVYPFFYIISLVVLILGVEVKSGKKLWRCERKKLNYSHKRNEVWPVLKHHENWKVLYPRQRKELGVLDPTADVHMSTFYAGRMFLSLLKSPRILAIDVSRSNMFVFMYVLIHVKNSTSPSP